MFSLARCGGMNSSIDGKFISLPRLSLSLSLSLSFPFFFFVLFDVIARVVRVVTSSEDFINQRVNVRTQRARARDRAC